MRRYHAALCPHDMQGSATDQVVVGPFIYVRFHFGTKTYGGRYPDDRLDTWAVWLAARAAPRDAVRLRQKIAGTIARRANARAPRTDTSDR